MSLKRKNLSRLFVLPLLASAGVAFGASGCGVPGVGNAACPEFSADAKFGAALDIDANVKTFMQAAGNFQVLGTAMVKDVGDACVKVATAAGGDTKKWDGMEGAELVKAACAEADAKLKEVLAGATIEVIVEGGQCRVEVQATAECNASCDVSGKCTPAQLEAKCEPGKLAGKCDAVCNGTCSADAGSIDCTGTCDATCTGTCSAQCTGTCAGNCNGTCDGTASTGMCAGTCQGQCDAQCTGKCDAECSGQCSGRCTATAPMAMCSGTCHGDCSVEYKAPYCEGKFTPPECMIDAKCEANCEASATAQATCTPPKVGYTVTAAGGVDLSALATVLEETLPVFIVNTVDRGDGLVASADALVTSGDAIAQGAGDLALQEGACAAAAADAAVAAAADIKVSVQFSVQVSASASGTASAM